MQGSDVWQAVLGEIEVSVSRGSYVTWFKNTCLLRYRDGVLIVGVANVFIKQQLETKYHKLISDTLSKNGINPKRIEYKTHTSATVTKKTIDEPVILNNAPTKAAPVGLARQNGLSHSYRQGLNERYTFENFIVGSGNELAYAACQAIAQSPGLKYNPLFLYGGVGIGKTHLIQAVGNQVLANNPKARVVYASTEQFVQEFVDALRYKKKH